VHVHVQQITPVEEADPPAAPGQSPGQRDVVGEVRAHWCESARGGQPGPAGQQALPVDHHPARARLAVRPDRAEPVDQGSQHGRVQGLLGGAVADEPGTGADQVERPPGGRRDQRPGQPGPGPRVGVQGEHMLARRHLQALL
jgi:hypothetical protein